MPVYVTLWKYTDQSIKDVKAGTADAASAKIVESMGGKALTGYWLMGPYDGIIITEFPDDETASAACLAGCARFGLRTTTMRAFDGEQFQRILDKLP